MSAARPGGQPLGRRIALHVGVLLTILAVFHITDLDIWVQDGFYDFQARRWLVNRKEPVGRWVFYHGAKGLVAVIGAGCAAAALLSCLPARGRRAALIGKLRLARRGCLLTALATAMVPLLVAGTKHFTNVYTPAQTRRYGGDKPYVKLLGRYPPGFQARARGKAFPAGHATGGFALMMLYFAFRRPGRRWAGLALGVVLGWTMGLYQMLNGQHYLGETVATMSASWIVILLIRWAVGRIESRAGCPA